TAYHSRPGVREGRFGRHAGRRQLAASGFVRMGVSGFTLCELGGELASFRNSVAGRWTAPEITHLRGATPARRMQPYRHRAILLTGPGYNPDSRDRSTAGGYRLNRRQFVKAAAFGAGAPLLAAASPAASSEQEWLPIAESLKPPLSRTPVTPAGIVRMAADPTQFLHWRAERVSPPEALTKRLLRRGDSAIIDFGRHLTGHLSFSIAGEGRGVRSEERRVGKECRSRWS